ncbi:recombination mediator RecR [Lentimicrobium sp.]|jgi:recombination protein RecR|uniref:recombination mediator RecR n=1 Tax=Lentimicrobium sp. TaxID=2034841 RepID=UPI00345ED13A
MNTYSSRLLEDAVNELTRLPGIGRRTALRLALHLLRQDAQRSEALGNAIIRLRSEVRYCSRCHNISDVEICAICADHRRDHTVVCVVEDIRDVMAIENTGQFRGVYHVLGGVISPMDGIGPGDLNIASLEQRAVEETVSELIMALPATTEGDTTNFYLYKRLHEKVGTISAISRGVAIGDDLEFADEVTLGKSILNRVPYHKTF